MAKKSSHHLIHFLVLFLIFAIGGVLLFHFQGYPTLKIFISLGTVLAYVVWGIVHHWLEKRLRWEIVLEYILVGALVFGLLYFRFS